MTKTFKFEKTDNDYCVFGPDENVIAMSLKLNEWESNFFNRKIGMVEINVDVLKDISDIDCNTIFDSLISSAKQFQYRLISTHLDIMGIDLVPVLEEKGFRLVDTRISFITLMDKSNIQHFTTGIENASFAGEDDLEAILDLTQFCVVENPYFRSRFKNRKYFSSEESSMYFSAWIKNHLNDKDSFFAVLKNREKVVGYFIYKRAEKLNGYQLYRGILAAVDPEYRGHHAHLVMQSFLYDHFPETQFYLDNTTQLTNFATIANHIRSRKNLSEIKLTFFKSF